MSQNARQKLSPQLKNFVSFSSLTPVLIESTPDSLNNLVNVFDSFGIEVSQFIPTFGFVAGLASVPLIKTLALLPEVRMVHPDMAMSTFSIPPSTLDSLLNVLPLDNLLSPLSLASNVMTSMGGSIFGKTLDPIFSRTITPLLDGTLDLLDPLNLFNPLSNPLGLQPESPTQFSRQEELVTQSQTQELFSTITTRGLLGAGDAEDIGITGKGVKVAILDTGIDINHAQVSPATDFDNAIVGHPKVDENGHGTHCATTTYGLGTINARNIAVKGVAIDATPIAIKVLGGGIGTGRNSDILKGIEMAYLKGADIISMSLGAEADQNASQDPSLTDPTSRVITALTLNEGIIFAIAAGNSGPEAQTVGLPGGVEEAITVGAIDPRNDQIAGFSSRGPFYGRIKPDISSYGVDIYSGTSFGSLLDTSGDRIVDGYTFISGTSMATPHIAGLLALVKQAFPDITAPMIKEVFKSKGIKKDSNLGFGIARWNWFN